MRQDAASLSHFYATPLGRVVQRMALAKLRAAWEDVSGLDVLGFGYAGPFLDGLSGTPRRSIAAMPSEQGAEPWPQNGRCRSLLTDETRLPLRDALFDRVLLAHALEEAETPTRLLREIWRVTAPEGRVIVIVANRAGAWTLTEGQPFGHGRPYSRSQLAGLLRNNLFEPMATARAVYAPPWPWAPALALADGLEKIGAVAAPGFGGLLLMEAVKRLTAPPPPKGALAKVRAVVKPALPRPQEQVTLGALQHCEEG